MDQKVNPSVVAYTRKRETLKSTTLIQIDNFLRRAIDIILSLVGMVILAPFFVMIAIAIKRSSPGPIFYWGPRAGKGGKTFKILKFRTMYERKESYQGPKVTAENDSRITPLGRILRQTKINELPQLWNVLRGDMSLVGPRPRIQLLPPSGPKKFAMKSYPSVPALPARHQWFTAMKKICSSLGI
jgi:lipopolysaccharide/colanic/teichoic acid biosynthesis glycosyltransferase